MTYVKNRGTGQNVASTDVAKVPPGVPTPFPNIGMENVAIASYPTVMLDNYPILTIAAVIPVSSGDEPGSLGGVVSQTIKGPVQFTKGSIGVFVGGAPIVTTTGQNTHNTNNAMGVSTVPPQTWFTVAT